MLAALVVLLLLDFSKKRSALRVVYIPDCSLLLSSDAVEQLQQSLLLAFADNAAACQALIDVNTGTQLKGWLKKHATAGTLLFVVDQYDALTANKDRDDSSTSNKKGAARDLLTTLSSKHCIVRAISINDNNKGEVERRQSNQIKLHIDGELSEVSTAHYTSSVPAAVNRCHSLTCVSAGLSYSVVYAGRVRWKVGWTGRRRDCRRLMRRT